MKKKIVTVAAALSTFCGAAYAEPVLLGTVIHDYGMGSGKTQPAGTNTLQSDRIQIGSKKVDTFADGFDISALLGEQIDHFVLTLSFKGTSSTPPWDFWLGAASQMLTLPASTDEITREFQFTANSLLGFVNNGLLSFGLGYEGNTHNNSAKFYLYDATLSVFGIHSALGDPGNPSNPGNPGGPGGSDVPEPGTLALLGIGLLGAVGLRRKR